MSSENKTNFETVLECLSPHVSVHYHTENRAVLRIGASSPSSEAARKPFISLGDVWSAYEEWSCYGHGVPLKLPIPDPDTSLPFTEITQYYAPTLSAMQIFTLKPFAAKSASSKSGSSKGTANRNAFSDYKHPYLSAEHVGYLYFEHNEQDLPFHRLPLYDKITELAEEYNGLNSLTSSDLSPYSWVSVAWYPIYSIPPAKGRTDLSAAFLTYHRLKPDFQEKSGEDGNGKGKEVSSKKEGKSAEDGKGKGKGVSIGKKGTSGEVDKVNGNDVAALKEVVLPPFGALTYHAFGNVWFVPGSSDYEKMERLEEHAFNFMHTFGVKHHDLNFFLQKRGGGRLADLLGSLSLATI